MTAAVKGSWFEVPPNARPGQCRSCKAVIYWIETAAGRKMPVDCEVDGAFEPRVDEAGRGVSHFSVCPDANQWRKRK